MVARPPFHARLVLAATLSPTYGIYSGFENYEHMPVKPGSEEYLDSEKYEAQAAHARRTAAAAHPADQPRPPRETRHCNGLDNVTFLDTANDSLIAYAKQSEGKHGHHRGQHRSAQRPGGGSSSSPAQLGLPAGLFQYMMRLTTTVTSGAMGGNYVRLAPGRSHLALVEVS